MGGQRPGLRIVEISADAVFTAAVGPGGDLTLVWRMPCTGSTEVHLPAGQADALRDALHVGGPSAEYLADTARAIRRQIADSIARTITNLRKLSFNPELVEVVASGMESARRSVLGLDVRPDPEPGLWQNHVGGIWEAVAVPGLRYRGNVHESGLISRDEVIHGEDILREDVDTDRHPLTPYVPAATGSRPWLEVYGQLDVYDGGKDRWCWECTRCGSGARGLYTAPDARQAARQHREQAHTADSPPAPTPPWTLITPSSVGTWSWFCCACGDIERTLYSKADAKQGLRRHLDGHPQVKTYCPDCFVCHPLMTCELQPGGRS